MNDKTNVVSIYLAKNIVRYKVFQKYLMMPQEEVIGRLINEEEAKNKAHRFIEKEGLMYKFSLS